MSLVFLPPSMDIVNILLTPYYDQNGDTAIAIAASFGHFGIVKALIAKGADVNSKDKVFTLF